MSHSYKIYSYATAYHPPFPKRSGYLLHLIRPDREGWGEIAPLPGRSRETPSQALAQLIYVLERDLTTASLTALFPSVGFGLFSALYDAPPMTPLPLSALLAGTPDQILSRAEIARNQGYTSVKVKISGVAFDTIPQLINPLSGQFTVRIDANRAFSFKEAMDLCARCTFEYIEEPTRDLYQLEHFSYPFALDESLLELKLLPKTPHFKAMVYKPSVLGIYEPRLKDKKIILSSACETGVGILGIAHLAQALAIEISPLGLDTYRFLCQDVLCTSLDLSKGMLMMPDEIHVNTRHLKEIAHG